ncbi:hypothetical protein L7F22_064810 [Adiantum nelumboides]|nr:hypothetical protein [Adiantum nelumboides]
MGGACSRKRSHDEESGSSRLSKSISSKWPHRSSFNSKSDVSQKSCKNIPSLLEQAVSKTCEAAERFASFSVLPKDLSQQLLNELIKRECLMAELFSFWYIFKDVLLGYYPGVEDSWLEVIGSQGHSLLAVDISSSAVSDSGLMHIRDCASLQSLSLNYCDNISEAGLQYLTGFKNLTSLNFKRSNAITAAGLRYLAELDSLRSLDLERCPQINGGLRHIRGLTKLERLNLGWCNCIDDQDVKALVGLSNLQELHISRSKVTDSGIMCLAGE